MNPESVLEIINFNSSNFSGIQNAAIAFVYLMYLTFIIWVLYDINKRTKKARVKVIAVLLVTVLNLPGLLIYLLFRPSSTLEEKEGNNLYNDKRDLSVLEKEIVLCPACEKINRKEFKFCIDCASPLELNCKECGTAIEPVWKFCPECKTALKLQKNDKDFNKYLTGLSGSITKLKNTVYAAFENFTSDLITEDKPKLSVKSQAIRTAKIKAKPTKTKKRGKKSKAKKKV